MLDIEDLQGNGAFCAMAWLHFHITTTGASTPCCLSDKPFTDYDGNPFDIQRHSIEEIWNSDSYNRLRQDMQSGVRNPACAACYKNEDVCGSSTRTAINSWLLEQHERAQQNAAIVVGAMNGNSAPQLPGYVDMRLSNLCNLGCRMCCSDASSQIQNDPIHSQWAPYHGSARQPGSNLVPLNSSNSPTLEELKKFDDLYFIQLAGGEPTVNKAQISWLTWLAQSGASKKIDLKVWTNFTTSNRAIFDVIAEFRDVGLVLSLDGTGAIYDYIRWPGRWSMIERNLSYIAKFRPRVSLELNCVVQAYNVDNIVELCEWARANDIRVMLHHVTGCEYLDYRVLSVTKQKRFHDTLSKYAAGLGQSFVDASIKSAIAEVLSRTADTWDEARKRRYLRRFIELTNDLDHQRKQSIKDSIPQVYADIASMHAGHWPAYRRFTSSNRTLKSSLMPWAR